MESIEQKSIEIVTKVVKEWTAILEGYGCNIGQIELNNNGDKDNYFSEIEAYMEE
jgi:hypothetical protein